MTGNLLSDAALHQVRELIRQESGRARGERTWYEPPLTKGPECFMAYASSGIDALSGTTPGYADCDLYELASDGTLSALMLDGSTNNQRTVYNASATAVSSGVYTPVWRDKLGTWWVAPWGGSRSAQMFSLAWVDSSANAITTLNSNAAGTMKATADTEWSNAVLFSALSMSAGTDYNIQCEASGSYIVHAHASTNPPSWVSGAPTDPTPMTITLGCLWKRPPSTTVYGVTGFPQNPKAWVPFQPWTLDPRGFFCASTIAQAWEAGDQLRFTFGKSSGVSYEYNLSNLSCRVTFELI